MAGLSSKAFGRLENNGKTFQEQKFDSDLGINYDQFKWRNHDPQIGRFIEIDPLAEKYVYNSTYSFSENHVTSHDELEGLEKAQIKEDACPSCDQIFSRATPSTTDKHVSNNTEKKS